MSNWPLNPLGVCDNVGVATASSLATSLGTGYTQLIASTAHDWQGFIINLTNLATGNATCSIGVGAAAAEFPIAQNLWLSNFTSWYPHWAIYVPCKIPKGSRISGKCSSTIDCSIIGLSQGLLGINGAAFLENAGDGVSGANRGTALDPGTSSNVKGTWNQLKASTTYRWKGIIVLLGTGQSTSATASWMTDIGIGAAASEAAFLSNLFTLGQSTKLMPGPLVAGPFPCNIAAGSRIAARSQCSTSTATTRINEAAVYGIV